MEYLCLDIAVTWQGAMHQFSVHVLLFHMTSHPVSFEVSGYVPSTVRLKISSRRLRVSITETESAESDYYAAYRAHADLACFVALRLACQTSKRHCCFIQSLNYSYGYILPCYGVVARCWRKMTVEV